MNHRLHLALYVTLLTLFALAPVRAQTTFNKAFSSASGAKKVTLIVEDVDLHIEGYAGNEVRIEGEGYEGPPERAAGLRPLYNNASDNTGLGLQVDESNNEITIRKASHQSLGYRIQVPREANVSIEERGWTGGDFQLRNLTGEIEIASNGADILLDAVSGPVVASTTSGDIDVIFAGLNQEMPSSISNVSGHIDVQVPATAKASFDLSSVSGEIYTNLDLLMPEEKEGLHRVGGRKVQGTYNGGGVEISLRAISDNIYLRKAE